MDVFPPPFTGEEDREAVEGEQARYRGKDIVEAAINIVICRTEDLPASFLQVSCPSLIVSYLNFAGVRRSIHFDH